MFEHVKDLTDTVGVRAIKDSRECNHQLEASYNAMMNYAAFERIRRANQRMNKALGRYYNGKHMKMEAMELFERYVEEWHGFLKREDTFVNVEWSLANSNIRLRAMHAINVSLDIAHPEQTEMLEQADLSLVLELAAHYLTTQNFDLSTRLKGKGWAREPL